MQIRDFSREVRSFSGGTCTDLITLGFYLGVEPIWRCYEVASPHNQKRSDSKQHSPTNKTQRSLDGFQFLPSVSLDFRTDEKSNPEAGNDDREGDTCLIRTDEGCRIPERFAETSNPKLEHLSLSPPNRIGTTKSIST